MLKNIVNFFKCCKSQNKLQKQCLDSFPYKESDKFQTENFNKYKTVPSTVSESCKNTNVNKSPSMNDKEKTPEIKNERDLRVNDDEINPISENFKKDENNDKIERTITTKIEIIDKDIQQVHSNNIVYTIHEEEKDLNLEKNILNNYASNDKLIDLIKESESNINKENEKLNYENENLEKTRREEINKIIDSSKFKTEDEYIVKEDFDKIIVADKYIREDEKNMLVWVIFKIFQKEIILINFGRFISFKKNLNYFYF